MPYVNGQLLPLREPWRRPGHEVTQLFCPGVSLYLNRLAPSFLRELTRRSRDEEDVPCSLFGKRTSGSRPRPPPRRPPGQRGLPPAEFEKLYEEMVRQLPRDPETESRKFPLALPEVFANRGESIQREDAEKLLNERVLYRAQA